MTESNETKKDTEATPAKVQTTPGGATVTPGADGISTLNASAPKPKNSVSPVQNLPTTPYAVVGSGDTDTVQLSAVIYKNARARKSLSVHHLQRRLNELGYHDAYADQDGYYGDLTRDAFVLWQEDNDYDVTEVPTAETLQAIFEGDPNVTVALN